MNAARKFFSFVIKSFWDCGTALNFTRTRRMKLLLTLAWGWRSPKLMMWDLLLIVFRLNRISLSSRMTMLEPHLIRASRWDICDWNIIMKLTSFRMSLTLMRRMWVSGRQMAWQHKFWAPTIPSCSWQSTRRPHQSFTRCCCIETLTTN